MKRPIYLRKRRLSRDLYSFCQENIHMLKTSQIAFWNKNGVISDGEKKKLPGSLRLVLLDSHWTGPGLLDSHWTGLDSWTATGQVLDSWTTTGQVWPGLTLVPQFDFLSDVIRSGSKTHNLQSDDGILQHFVWRVFTVLIIEEHS